MPITIYEKWAGRQGSLGQRSSDEIGYIVFGADDHSEALAALNSAVPPSFGSNVLDDVTVKQIGEELWEGTARYLDPESKGEKEEQIKEIGDETFTFRTGGATQHITQDKFGTDPYTWATFPPDFGGAIGVNGDSVDGVDIVIPSLQFQITAKMPLSIFNVEYVKTCARLTGRVNAAPFRGFAPGEVLFMGLSGSKAGRESIDLTFDFGAEENATGLSIGSGSHEITGIAKKGWEYLWVHYFSYDDPDSKKRVTKPHSAYVARVYGPGDFSLLGIAM